MHDDTAQLIGRLLVVGVRGAEPGSPLLESDLAACEAAHCQGVVLFDQNLPSRSTRNVINPEQTRRLTGELRARLGGDDLIIAIDQEGGAVERLTSDRGFVSTPPAAEFATLSLGEQQRHARTQARQLAGLGINCNFAPCVDLARNAESDIIAGKRRAYSHDPTVTIPCARCILDAHRDAGVLACLKHFPGHGSAAGDTHLGLVDISLDARPDLELAPYHWLRDDAPMVMTGHLIDRFIDPDLPASLSPLHTNDLLRTRIGYQGVVVVDSLDMRAVADRWGLAEACVMAINAGADLLLDCNNAPGPERECPAPAMADAIRLGVESGVIEGGVDRLRQSAARIDQALRSLRTRRP